MFIVAFYPMLYLSIPICSRDNLRTLGGISLVLFIIFAILQVIIFYSCARNVIVTLYDAIQSCYLIFLEIILAIFSYYLTVFDSKWVLDAMPPDAKQTTTPLIEDLPSSPIPPSVQMPYEDVIQPEPMIDPHDPLAPPGDYYQQPSALKVSYEEEETTEAKIDQEEYMPTEEVYKEEVNKAEGKLEGEALDI